MEYEGGQAPRRGPAQPTELHRSRSAQAENRASAATASPATDKTTRDYLSRVFAQSAVGFYRTTPSGEILAANPALVRMLGFQSFDELAQRDLQKEGFAGKSPRGEFIQRVERNGYVAGMEATWLRRDGTPLYVRESARAIRDANGATVSYEGIVEDISDRKDAETARRLSEERLRAVFEAVHDCVFVKDASLKYIQVNRAVALLFGQPVADLVGCTDEDLFGQEAAAVIRETDHRVLAGEVVEREHAKPVRGEMRTFHVVKSPVRGADGDIIGICGVARDITDRKKLEFDLQEARDDSEQRVEQRTAELQESKQQLRRLAKRLQTVREDERKQLARELHDNLGQRLAGLSVDLSRLKSQLQRLGNLSEEQGPLIERLERMQRAIQDGLQDVQHIGAGLRPPGLDDLGLCAALEWAARGVQERTGIQCRVECSPEGFPVCPDCADDLFRICQEALTNAMRHAQATCVTIRVFIKGQEMVMEVSDDGRGITEQEINGPESLGLLGIRERALMWGGVADITGAPATGTRVSVVLPLAEVERRARGDSSARSG